MEDEFKLELKLHRKPVEGGEDCGKCAPTCVFLLRGEMHAWLVSA